MSERQANDERSQRRSIVLLSGGLDSATAAAMACSENEVVVALSFDYGQRHSIELQAARRVAESLGIERHVEFHLDTSVFGGSSLTDGPPVPKDRSSTEIETDIPSTYVPARNLVFLSIATALAESTKATSIYIGVNEVDYSGYPDCRPEFIAAFQQAADRATAMGATGSGISIRTPLIDLPKAEIIKLGTRLGVDYSLTHSCYDPEATGLACGRCDSCVIRARGFREAGVADPTRYAGSTPSF